MISAIKAPGTELVALPLDLESFGSVSRFVEEISRRGYAIRSLINNAGTMPGKVSVTGNGYESATQTNFLSTGLLTELLLPMLGNGSSIVFTTSMTRHIVELREDWEVASREHHGRFTTYGRSKLMLTHYAIDLALRLDNRGITVNCSDPGIVNSGIITMGNSIIDKLSDLFFRPFISQPKHGATAALNAAIYAKSGMIFTPRGSKKIPQSYLSQPLHHIASDAIAAVVAKVNK
jgi:NAD(P)-dependent dehydrogenase (short-subunit alcohol dehydrogenase family)